MISDKHKSLINFEKRTDEFNRKSLSPLIEPIIELGKTKSTLHSNHDVKKEEVKEEQESMEIDNEDDDDDEYEDEEEGEEDDDDDDDVGASRINDLLSKYLTVFHKEKLNNSITYGVSYKDQSEKYYIGDIQVIFDNGYIDVDKERIQLTRGLLELLFKARPNRNLYNQRDLDKYKKS